MKKIISMVLIMTLVNSLLTFAKEETNTNNVYLPAVSLGEPIETCKPLDVVTTEINGKDYMFTSSQGAPAVLNIYNIDDRKFVSSHKLLGVKSPWIHVLDSKNMLYIAADGFIFRYDPYKDELKELGRCDEGESASFVMCKDEEDNIYIGTFPSAKIIQFNQKTQKFVDLGRVDESANYVRSIAYHKGFLYAGTFGNNQAKFYQIDAKNPVKKKVYDIPENNAYYDKAKLAWLYTMNVADDLIVIYAKEQTVSPMLVFDTTTNAFVDIEFTGSFKGLYTSQPKNNKAYFFSKGKAYALNTKTKKVEDLDFTVDNTDYLPGSGWVTLEGNPDFPGETLLTVDVETGYPKFFNFETKKRMVWDDVVLNGGKIAIQSIENGPDNQVFVGGYMSNKAVSYDIGTGAFTEFPMGQTEGMIDYNGKQYFGIYTKAWLYEYDPAQPISASNPKALAQVGESQDRPFAMAAGDGKIFLGTIPDYSILGGAIAWYDLETKKMTTVRGIVEDQSIMSIAYRDGKIYGSTTVHGGLGSTPVGDSAKIFVYDVEKQELIKSFSPKVQGLNAPLHIGSIAFDENGKLWAVSGYTLFSVNPETEAVQNVLSFGNYEYKRTSHVWRPTYIRFDKKGNLYANLLGMKVVNTKTMKYDDLSHEITKSNALYTIGPDNNLYFGSGSIFKMIPITDHEITKEGLADATGILRERIGLMVGNPMAIRNGQVSYIDENNKKVVPIVENGRTLVPVRFIAEALGAQVDWDGQTNTATLKKGDLSISITLGKSSININGTEKPLDVPATTKEGRTLLPLRAVSDAFSKQVFWDNRGIIIISDDSLTLKEDQTAHMDAYFKYYIRQDYEDRQKALAAKAILDEKVAALKGVKLEIPNGDFEGTPSSSDPVPSFTKLNEFGSGCSVGISPDKTFTGKGALRIVDISTTDQTGMESQLIAIDPAKSHKLFVPLYLNSGRTSIGVVTYDQNKKMMKRMQYHQTPPIGIWNIIEIDLGAAQKNVAYYKIQLFTSEYWVSEAYYDDLTLIEY